MSIEASEVLKKCLDRVPMGRLVDKDLSTIDLDEITALDINKHYFTCIWMLVDGPGFPVINSWDIFYTYIDDKPLNEAKFTTKKRKVVEYDDPFQNNFTQTTLDSQGGIVKRKPFNKGYLYLVRIDEEHPIYNQDKMLIYGYEVVQLKFKYTILAYLRVEWKKCRYLATILKQCLGEGKYGHIPKDLLKGIPNEVSLKAFLEKNTTPGGIQKSSRTDLML